MSGERVKIETYLLSKVDGDAKVAERVIAEIVEKALPRWIKIARCIPFFPLNTEEYIDGIKNSASIQEIYLFYGDRRDQDPSCSWYARPRFRQVSKDLRDLGVGEREA